MPVGIAEQDIVIYRGDSKILNIIATLNDEPLNITGASIWMTAKSNKTDADPGVFQKTINDGITITNAVQGKATIEIEPADTSGVSLPSNLSPSGIDDYVAQLFYDIQVKLTDGRIHTVAAGKLHIVPDVTLSNGG